MEVIIYKFYLQTYHFFKRKDKDKQNMNIKENYKNKKKLENKLNQIEKKNHKNKLEVLKQKMLNLV